MYQNYKKAGVDPKNPYAPEFYGIFEIPVVTGSRTRRMLAYVPEDARESTAGVMILGENGKSADDLLKETKWCEIADQEETKEKMIVFFLEPENGAWNTNEPYGKPDGDVAYINEAALLAEGRTRFCVHESKLYLFGVKEGGILANMEAAWNPAYFAGIATVGGSDVNPGYLNKAAADYALVLDGYEDPSHRKGIRKGDIPMPAWILSDPSIDKNPENILNYWKTANGTEEKGYLINPDQLQFNRTAETPYPSDQEKEAYRVCFSSISGASEGHANRLLRRIWKNFLYRQRRWMGCPGGELRVTTDPVADLNMEYHYEEIDGWMREWYVYVPDSVKANPQEKVPLVVAMHGYTCNGEIYTGNSGWWKVADKYGFIVVHPSALQAHVNMPQCGLMPEYALFPAWNIFEEDDRPDELSFFRQMLDRVIAEHAIDENRIYATGHSWGSMMTQMLGLGMTDRFAAIAPCSGVFFGGASKIMPKLESLNQFPDAQLPVWMHWGTEEGWLIPGEPTHDNETGFTLEMWLKRNGKREMIPENWKDCPIEQNGRFLDHRFEKAGTAPVWFTEVDYMPHATMPEMSFRIWEQFFSHITKAR